jgi:hypothetical protein
MRRLEHATGVLSNVEHSLSSLRDQTGTSPSTSKKRDVSEIGRLKCSLLVDTVFIEFDGTALAVSVWRALQDGSQAVAACTAGVAANTLHWQTQCRVGYGVQRSAVLAHHPHGMPTVVPGN